MELQHLIFVINTSHVNVVMTSNIGLYYIVTHCWHMQYICVACGDHYARVELLYLNVDQNALPFTIFVYILRWALLLLTCKVLAQSV